ncbi:hypothetical protein PIB30_030050 [Stylosanthes scabra]|uniref:Transposase MuDR plant domain-containing protein n=1 Tax=Stylosanthes scabra TaxID=79078 RepID=A0ABU6TB90_9FABA|nr:hypothetical protein [Stylosanthes scabra]
MEGDESFLTLVYHEAQGVKYGCFAIEGDDDLQILFHCRRQFPEIRTTELFVVIVDPLASSGGSAPNPRNQREPDVRQVASPSFDFKLQAEAATGGDKLGDSRSFGELGFAITVTPQPLSPHAFQAVPDPVFHVGEALRPDDSDDEPQFIEGDSDYDGSPVPPQPPQGGTSSSGIQQEMVGLAAVHRSPKGRIFDIPAEFQVGQSFHSKDEAVLAVKNYNILQGVEYRVMESDHAKFLEKCKEFGKGCTWLIRLTLRKKKDMWEVRMHNGRRRSTKALISGSSTLNQVSQSRARGSNPKP